MSGTSFNRSVFLIAFLLFSISTSLAQNNNDDIATDPLEAPTAPAANPLTTAKINLGKSLFWDEQLSSTRTVACATCHRPTSGGADPRSVPGSSRATHPGADGVFDTDDDVTGSPGVPLCNVDGTYNWDAVFGYLEQVTSRKAPSAIDAAYSNRLFWDGRATQNFDDPVTGTRVISGGAALESQSTAPPVSSAEMGHIGRDWNDVAAAVEEAQPLALSPSIPESLETWIANRSYPELFAEAFGTVDVTPARIAMAIASYERALYSDQTPFDTYLAGNGGLTTQEIQGLNLFNSLNCVRCHSGTLMTDNNFHYLGLRPVDEDLGRYEVTGNDDNRGEFRTPSLRNVELRPSYMHNGQFSTLEEVIDFYDRGGDFDAPNKPDNIEPLNLTQNEKDALLAFLKRPLTDPRVAAQSAPFNPPVLYTESDRVPELCGFGISGSGGLTPEYVAIEPPLAGNPSFTVAVYNALGGAEAVLIIDTVEPTGSVIPEAETVAYAFTTNLTGSGNGQGHSSIGVPLPNGPGTIGTKLYGRWYIDEGGGVSASPAFSFTLFGTERTDIESYEDWRIANFGISNTSGVTSMQDDSDNDGFSNLLEYYTGSDPSERSPECQPQVTTVSIDGQSYPSFTYRRRMNATDVIGIVEVSEDLVTWHNGSTYITDLATPSANGDGTETLTARTLTSLANMERVFIRLRVEPLSAL